MPDVSGALRWVRDGLMVVDAHGITIMPIQNIELTEIADRLCGFLKRYCLDSVHIDVNASDDMEKPQISIRTYDMDGQICMLTMFYDDDEGSNSYE